MNRPILALAASLAICVAVPLSAKVLTVMSYGPVNQIMHAKAYTRPFAKATGIKLNSYSYGGGLDEIRAMVGAGKTSWDVVEVETADLLTGCKQGLFETLDTAKLGFAKDLIPGALFACGVGTYVWSTVIAWNPQKVRGAITSWADFWDVKKHPGPRGLPRTAKYSLEIALLADGVPPTQLYKVLATREGVDRAFGKLDEIKPYIKWWEAAAQAPVWLKSGQVDMAAAYSLWIDSAQRQGLKFRTSWNGSLYELDSWAIVKGAQHLDDAYRFIAFASRPENQKIFSDSIAYGPTNK